MNIFKSRQQQLGVGLIEILVVLVVIAVGVIAVLGLQGTLMSGSSTAKARNEAMSLAREKIEELRNTVELGQYETELAVEEDMKDDPDGKIDGINAQFTRRWSIVDATTVERAKEIVMQVRWTDAAGETNTVELNTLVAYASPLISALGHSNPGSIGPGQPDTGYEGLHPNTPIDEEVSDDRDESEDEEIREIKDLDTHMGITDVLRYSNGHVQVRIPDLLCPSVTSTSTDCTCPQVDRVNALGGHAVDCVVFTAFGGTLLRFGGTVHVDGYLNNYTEDEDKNNNGIEDFDEFLLVKATSAAYCAHQRKTGDECTILPTRGNETHIDCVEYVCYVSGDCTHGGADCPTGDALEAMGLPDLKGGWRGKIGYYFPGETNLTNPDFPLVCMGKEIKYEGGERVLKDNESAARTYYSLREITDENNDTTYWREGINQSYLGHNTVIGDTKNYDCDTAYKRLTRKGVVWNSFVGPEIIRELDADDVNDVLGVDDTYDDIVSIYGSVVENITTVEFNEPVDVYEAGDYTFIGVDTASISDPPYSDKEEECFVVQETNGNDVDTYYACNIIDDSWSGDVIAEGTAPYEMSYTDPETHEVIEKTLDFDCDAINTYVSATGSNPGETLTVDTCKQP